MSFEEEFDKGIRNKMEEASYPFDQANWEKASGMLDAERKAAAPFGGAKFYIPVIAVGVIVLGWMLFSVNKPESLASEPVVKTEAPETNAVTEAINEEKILAQKDESGINNKELAPAVKAPEADKQIVSNAELKNETSLKSPETNIANGNKSNLKAQNQKNENKATESFKSEKTETASVPQAPVKENNTASAFGKNIPVSDPVFAMEPQNAFTNSPAVQTEEAKEKETSAPQAISMGENTSVNENAFEYLTLLGLDHAIQDADLRQSAFVFLSRYDDDYYKKLRSYKKHFVNAEAGANYNMGWQIANTTDGKGFNWFGGLNYGYYLSKKIAIGAGFQAYNLGNTSQNFYEVSSINYDFGSVTTGTLISSKNMFYFAIPLKLYYSLNKSNQIGLGFNAAYLFNAKSNLLTYSVQEGATIYNKNEVVKGVYSCTNPYNFMLSAFYKLQLAKRWAVNAEAVYGLTDIFKNKGNIKASETPAGLRLSLQYTLFDK